MSKFLSNDHMLSFDDVLIVPNVSDISPDDCDTKTRLTSGLNINIPIISAAMDTVTGFDMALNMALLGGIGVVHRNFSITEQTDIITKIKSYQLNEKEKLSTSLNADGLPLTAAAIGTGDGDLVRAKSLIEAGCDVIVVDTAHGHSKKVIEMVRKVKALSDKNIKIIAGNIVTKNAAVALINEGVDAIKVGVGPGAICTTRIISGIGMPQLSAILEVSEVCKQHSIPIIADGGIKNSGDITKAIAAGADSVMLGSLLARTDKSIGEIVLIDGKEYKKYRGMGSIGAMKDGSYDRYFQRPDKKHMISQGVEGYVPYDGTLEDIIQQLVGGLKTGMGYTGSRNIAEMHGNKALFVKITQSGIRESHVHDLSSFENTDNYKFTK